MTDRVQPPPSLPVVAIRLMRPHQWTKNAFCLAGLIFSGRYEDADALANAFVLAVLFCAISSAMYILNDLLDCQRDREHPKKRFRPLPSGQIAPSSARLLGLTLFGLAVLGALFLDRATQVCLVCFVVLQVVYSFWLKHEVILDVGGIALGFVLRLLAGVFAVGEMPTTWITLCTFFLALFLGFAKRRAELNDLAATNGNHQRPVLAKYSLVFLDSLLNSMATMTIVCYALFTIASGRNPSLVITVPIVVYAILYYKLIVVSKSGAEEPERILLQNRSIQASIALWLLLYLWIVHTNVQLFR